MAREDISLDFRPNNSIGREKERKGKRDRRRKQRERLYIFSRFSDDRTVGFRRSKRESLSSRQELQVEIGNGEFRQTFRGRFSPTLIIFYLKGCVVVSCPKGNAWLHFEL